MMHIHKWSPWKQIVVDGSRVIQGKLFEYTYDAQERYCTKCMKRQTERV